MKRHRQTDQQIILESFRQFLKLKFPFPSELTTPDDAIAQCKNTAHPYKRPIPVTGVIKRQLHQAENSHESVQLERTRGTKRKHRTILNQFIRTPQSYHSKRTWGVRLRLPTRPEKKLLHLFFSFSFFRFMTFLKS